MFNSNTYTNTNTITSVYQQNTENIFKASQPKTKMKRHKSLTDLLKENPLLGKTKYNELNECSLNIIA